MINCVIVDDEPLARECITNYVQEIEFLNLIGQGSNPLELTNLMDHNKVDLVFLDVQMPIMNGIDYLKMNQNLPMIILTTAYPSYALEGYELDIMDYLLKPITFNRFFQAATKSKEYFQLTYPTKDVSKTDQAQDYFFVKCSSKYEKIYLDSILFIQAMQNYVVIQTKEEKYMTLMNLKSVDQKLGQGEFMKVHKSYIVSVKKVDSIENHEAKIDRFTIPISRNYRKEVLDRVLGNRLW